MKPLVALIDVVAMLNNPYLAYVRFAKLATL